MAEPKYKPLAVDLSKERVAELHREGLELRREVEKRMRKMRPKWWHYLMRMR